MTNPRLKADREAGNLGETAKGVVKDWYRSQLYMRKRQIYSKYLEKGNENEQDNLVFATSMMGLPLTTATNREFYEDEHFTGTPDLLFKDEGIVLDIKTSWDCYTFPLFDGEGNDPKYYWQMQVYMALTGMTAGKVVYVLSNTPDPIVEREIKYAIRDLKDENGGEISDEVTEKVKAEIMQFHNYDNIESRYKLKVIDYKYDPDDIDKARAKVEKAREYLETIKF